MLELGIIAFSALGLLVVVNPVHALMRKPPAPTRDISWAIVNVPKPPPMPTQTASAPQETNEQTVEQSTPIVDDGSLTSNDLSASDQENDDGRWIDVNLSQQQIYVYEGDVLVNSFIVSTGLPDTPTVTGDYRIYVKVPVQDMSGPGYYLSDVPWVMFFYEDYGFHGTYWHNNFGTPMSRGCVNLSVEDAEWLYNWASVGTRVSIHY